MTTTTPSDQEATPEILLRSLREVGGAWARYGLNIGRVALETQAGTLRATAGALGALAEALDRKTADKPVVDGE